MKKIFGVAVLSVLLLIVLNIFYYQRMYQWQMTNQQHMLEEELYLSAREITSFYLQPWPQLPLMGRSDIDVLFNQPQQANDIKLRLQSAFLQNAAFLDHLRVVTSEGQYFNIKKGSQFTTVCEYDTCQQPIFNARTVIDTSGQFIVCHNPIWGNDKLIAYIEYRVNTQEYFKSLFHRFGSYADQFQWLASNNNLIYTTSPDLSFDDDPFFFKEASSDAPRHVIHQMNIKGKSQEVLSVIQPLHFFNETHYLAFSIPTSRIADAIIENTLWVGGISTFVMIMVIVGFLLYSYRRAQHLQRTKLSQEAVRKMIYYLPSGVMLLDDKMKIIQVNRWLMQLVGIDNEDLLISHPLSSELLFSNVELIESFHYNQISSKYVIRKPDGQEVVILNEKTPFYLHHDRYWIDSYVVVSEVESPQKNREAQNIFVANISHELRTPLNGIIGMIDLLSQSLVGPAEAEMLAILKRSSDMLLSLINDILDFSKIQSGKFDIESIPFDLNREISETLNYFQPRAKEAGLKLEWHTQEALPDDFLGDPVRIRQIINNLISNAIKFTPRGKIAMTISPTRLINGNPALLFSVKDTGIGIAKEKQRDIFKSFQQADESTTRKYGGTGLGTTIASELVHLMGGEIWINSPSDLSDDPDYPGSEFCFTLPIRTRRQLKNINTTEITDFSQIKSVVVSDDPTQVQVIARNLAALKVDCQIMSPTQETIDILTNNSNIQLLIIDNRPDYNGMDFLHELFNHQLHRNFIILFQSSDNQNTNTHVARKLGADAYLRKPVRLIVLRDLILKHFPNIRFKAPIEAEDWQESLKILLAEDNTLNQKVAQSLFRKIGFTIDLASNGNEAVEMAKQKNYDIIFMDIYMPDKDGIEAATELKNLNFAGAIIALTASNDIGERRRSLDAGMDDHICKPARVEEIQQMLTKWCSRKN
jgi:signal transduction histidine kinase/DNA-binding response OmpR family regulator